MSRSKKKKRERELRERNGTTRSARLSPTSLPLERLPISSLVPPPTSPPSVTKVADRLPLQHPALQASKLRHLIQIGNPQSEEQPMNVTFQPPQVQDNPTQTPLWVPPGNESAHPPTHEQRPLPRLPETAESQQVTAPSQETPSSAASSPPPPTLTADEWAKKRKAEAYEKARTEARGKEISSLTFSPLAWMKYQLFCHHNGGHTEIAGFAITKDDDYSYIEEFVTVKQEVTGASWKFDPVSVGYYVEDQFVAGRMPDQCMRICLHTHPGASTTPSGVDEDWFNTTGADSEWVIMVILGKTGSVYARLGYFPKNGPRFTKELESTVDWQRWADLAPTTDLNALRAAWLAEFNANIQAHVWTQPVWTGQQGNFYNRNAPYYQSEEFQRTRKQYGYEGYDDGDGYFQRGYQGTKDEANAGTFRSSGFTDDKPGTQSYRPSKLRGHKRGGFTKSPGNYGHGLLDPGASTRPGDDSRVPLSAATERAIIETMEDFKRNNPNLLLPASSSGSPEELELAGLLALSMDEMTPDKLNRFVYLLKDSHAFSINQNGKFGAKEPPVPSNVEEVTTGYTSDDYLPICP